MNCLHKLYNIKPGIVTILIFTAISDNCALMHRSKHFSSQLDERCSRDQSQFAEQNLNKTSKPIDRTCLWKSYQVGHIIHQLGSLANSAHPGRIGSAD